MNAHYIIGDIHCKNSLTTEVAHSNPNTVYFFYQPILQLPILQYLSSTTYPPMPILPLNFSDTDEHTLYLQWCTHYITTHTHYIIINIHYIFNGCIIYYRRYTLQKLADSGDRVFESRRSHIFLSTYPPIPILQYLSSN